MFAKLWARAQAAFERLFPHEPEPGRFESGSEWSLRGFLAAAPLVLPSREFLVYIPKGRSAWRRAPLVVLCHGCKQTPEEFAQGTRITELADRHGFVVLLPRQKDKANPWRCWNWFDTRTMKGAGEAAIVAAQIRFVRRRYRCQRKRVLVAGMSAGGAFAAVMGLRYPRLVAAVAVHSGLACGAARSPLTAIAVMQNGPEQDVAARGCTSARPADPAARDPGGIRSGRVAAQRRGAGPAISPPQRPCVGRRCGCLRLRIARRRRRNAHDACERPHRAHARVAQRRSSGRATGRGDGAGPCVERRRRDPGVQRRGGAGRDGARRRVFRRCTILTPVRDEDTKPMAISAMNHFTVLTDDVSRTVHFYCNLLGLTEGARPDLGFPGAWLYAGDAAVLHVVGGKSREQLKPGVIDHMAFSATGLSETLALLITFNVEHTCRRQTGTGTWQVFLFDPNGARVELDFAANEVQTRQ
jgi:poly(hydroxyalkanoate) depolymerase family esterase